MLWRDSQVIGNVPPIYDDRAVYHLSLDHNAAAVSKVDGHLLWRTHLPVADPGNGGIGLTLAGGRLVVGDIDVFGLDPATGTIAWYYTPSRGRSPGYQKLTSDGTTVYCGSTSGDIFGVDGATGAERWATHVSPDASASLYNPVVSNGVVFVGFSDLPPGTLRYLGGVAAVDATSGQLLWTRMLPRPDTTVPTASQGVAVAPTLVIAASQDGTVYGLDRQTGDVRYTLPKTLFVTQGFTAPDQDLRPLIATGQTVLVGSTSGFITALAANDLHKLWITNFSRGTVWDMQADGSRVYASYLGGQLAVFQLSDGNAVWWVDRFDLRPAGDEGTAYAPAIDSNPLYSRIYTGGVREVYSFSRR